MVEIYIFRKFRSNLWEKKELLEFYVHGTVHLSNTSFIKYQ